MTNKSPLHQSLTDLRQHLHHARIPHKQSISQDISNALGLARVRLTKAPLLRLRFSNRFAYRFRYLHVGLTQLAGKGSVDYRFHIDKSLGRKTAVIEYTDGNPETTIAVIDGSDLAWQLGDPHIDLNTIFGSAPRILFKLEFGLSQISEHSSGREATTDPTIRDLYHQVLDGAYWPINKRFLDSQWVTAKRAAHGETIALFAAYGLQPNDFISGTLHGSSEFSQRTTFAAMLHDIRAEIDGNLIMRVYLQRGMFDAVPEENIPVAVRNNVSDEGFPFDEYLDHTLNAQLNFAPKNSWHHVTPDLTAHRTYRLLELLSFGRVCLMSPVQLHTALVPDEHYVSIAHDLSDIKPTIEKALSNPGWLASIRDNVLPLYDQHLSPISIARYYVKQLSGLHTGEIPKVAWEVTS